MQASAVAINGAAVLLTGPSGSGKSDLCLRLMDRGAVLVADDFVELTRQAADVLVSPPASIRGLLEIRGLGIKRFACVEGVPVKMVFRLKAPDKIERLPSPDMIDLCGTPVPVFDLYAFAASATAIIMTALESSPGDFVQ